MSKLEHSSRFWIKNFKVTVLNSLPYSKALRAIVRSAFFIPNLQQDTPQSIIVKLMSLVSTDAMIKG